MKRTLLVSSLAGVMALVGPAILPVHHVAAAGSVLLRAQFVAGAHYTELDVSDSVNALKGTITLGAQKQPLVQNQHEIDRFLVTVTVKKVYPDGSGLVRFTLGSGSVTTNGKTVTATPTAFYHDEHLDTRLHLLSQKVVGLQTLPKALQGAVPSFDPDTYPAAPVAVGGTWTRSQTIPGLGKVSAVYTLKAIGSQGGLPTASAHAAIAQPVKLTSSGLQFNGTVVATNDTNIVVATGQNVTPAHTATSFTGKLSGLVSGATVKGSFSFTGTETITPQP